VGFVGDAPHPPWAVRGEILLAWARWPDGRADRLPGGVAPLPGPVAIAAARYSDSPVGPYLELSVGEPARIGLRPGLCVTSSVVSDPAAKVGWRLNWGMPAGLGQLSWAADGDERELVWEDRGIVVRGHPAGPPLPVILPIQCVQRRGDGPILAPRRLTGLARLARVTVKVPEGDPLAPLAGDHLGAIVGAARLRLRPARRPSGLLSSLRAPSQAPEAAHRS
jgi:hypothetical protein